MLDDVLSAVDHENEKKLVQELSNLSSSEKQTTVILVSNRLSAFRFADQIVVLDNGEIIDRGTHEELIDREGLYKDTWQIQSDDVQSNDIQSDESTTTQ